MKTAVAEVKCVVFSTTLTSDTSPLIAFRKVRRQGLEKLIKSLNASESHFPAVSDSLEAFRHQTAHILHVLKKRN